MRPAARDHRPRFDATENYTDRTVRLEDTRKIPGVSDVTKIIVFRNTEGGTTAFDKTFSTIPFSSPFSAILVSPRSMPAVARKRVTSGTKGIGGGAAQRRNSVKTPSGFVSCIAALRCIAHRRHRAAQPPPYRYTTPQRVPPLSA